jgi:hypothetical protein
MVVAQLKKQKLLQIEFGQVKEYVHSAGLFSQDGKCILDVKRTVGLVCMNFGKLTRQ